MVCAVIPATTLWGQSEPAITTTVCKIVKKPDALNGKRVRFRAMAESDGIERTVLIDKGCDLGIAPFSTEKGDHDPGVQAFERALQAQRAGTAYKKVTGIFYGRFESHVGSIPRFVLRVEHIDELKVIVARHP
jgi:hypothetical protein